MRYSDYTLVSPDIIRKEINGSISDQSNGDKVFAEVDRRVNELVRKGESFFYDATNTNPRFRKEFSDKFRETGADVIYVVLPADVNLSFKRIQNDLENNVERSNVPYQVLLRQYSMYNDSVKSGFEGENVQKVIYIKPGDLEK